MARVQQGGGEIIDVEESFKLVFLRTKKAYTLSTFEEGNRRIRIDILVRFT